MLSKCTLVAVTFVLALFVAGPYLAGETLQQTAGSYVDLGDKLAREGDYQRAVATYNLALQFSADFAPAFLHRGFAYEAQGNFTKAIARVGSAG